MVAQLEGNAAPRFFGMTRMPNKIPYADPAIDPNRRLDDTQLPAVVATRRKATFQWPPDCLWPFIDQARRASEQRDEN
jgi:hypothetical protein